MIYLILFVYSVVFVELFIKLNIIQDAKNVIRISTDSIEVMKSSSMTDREKEAYMRTNSLKTMKVTLIFIMKFIAIPLIIILLNSLLQLVNTELSDQVVRSFSSLKIIIIMTSVTMFYIWIRNVIRTKL